MSTKLHHGYRIDGNLDLWSLSELLREFGIAARAEIDRLRRKLAATLATDLIDATKLGQVATWDVPDGHRAAVRPVSVAQDFMEAKRKEIATTGHRNPQHDFDCNLCVIPHQGKIYALLYTEQASLTRLWREDVRGVTPYPYWDNTDGPVVMSEEAWNQRGEEWDAVLRNGVPAHVGMTFEVCDKYLDTYTADEVAAAQPDVTDRVNGWSKSLVRDGYCAAHKSAKSPNPSDWYEMMSEVSAWLQTEQGVARLEATSLWLASILKPLTVEDFRTALVPVRHAKQVKA